MQRKFRLTRSTDFKRVRRLGKSYAHPLVVLVALRSESRDEPTQIGISAGRSVGNAVQRNRAKRLLRAAAQTLSGSIVPGWQLVLLARRPLVKATYHEVLTALAVLMKKARLLLEDYVEELPGS